VFAGTHQSPIRIKAYGTILADPPAAPGAFQHPRKPSVPERVHFTDRPPATERRLNRNLAAACEARANLIWLTLEAYPSAVRIAWGDACLVFLLQSTSFSFFMDRRRRPNQNQWLETRHLFGLAAPS
jgi:hypothetical protein